MNLRVIKIILFVILISGCSVREDARGILRIRIKEDPTTLDPIYIVDVVGGSISAKLYRGLVRFDENCRIVPDIAQSWEVSGDGLIYTFKLQMSPEVVKNRFEEVIKKSPRKWIFEKVKEFRVLDDKTLQIELKEPFSPFLSLLTMPNAYIADGPYRLALWEHDRRIVLEPREPVRLKGIEYVIIPEEFTAKAEFDLGNIDIMEVSPVEWVNMTARKNGIISLYSQVGLNVYYIGFNCERFKNTRFRQALNYAIDKESIIKNTLNGQAVISGGPVPPTLLKTSYPYPYLPNRAKRLLKGQYPLKLKLYVRAQTQAIQIAEAIQHYLKKIGTTVDIIPLEWSAFKEAINKGEPDLFLMSWWADYPDPENFLFPTFHSTNIGPGGNRARFRNSLIDKLIEEAQRTGDQKLYKKLQRYINRQAPWIFLWHTKELVITQPWVKGFRLYPVYNSDKGTEIYKSD